MPQLLLELFSEEIPARMQAQAGRDLERMAKEALAKAGLQPERLIAHAGPRRLTLVAEGLPTATPDREEELKGPRANAPEQALDGFLRKTGLSRDQLTERDGVFYATLSTPGRATADIIAEAVPQIMTAFPWPKSMRSGTTTFRWVRPLKRILCLFDGKVVPFEAGGVTSGDLTEGHRFMGSNHAPFAVRDFADYAEKLKAHFVVLDQAERKRLILDGAHRVCAAEGLQLVEDEGLLEEVSGLSEWPTPILGRMDPAFLDLPAEVIRTSMRTHQKYFAVAHPSSAHSREGGNPAGTSTAVEAASGSPPSRGGADLGKLAPHFVVVANIEPTDGGAVIAAGNAKVLSARLNDARFFWDQDKTPGSFDKWLGKLRGVTFHAKLGTLAERVERIEALAREIAPLVGADPELAGIAARYCKADLASGMVGEFSELQGIMGGYYARASFDTVASRPAQDDEGGAGSTNARHAEQPAAAGVSKHAGGLSRAEADAVADAIRDHYKPVGPSDSVPTAPVTVAVALADKLDTLVGFFAIDEKPTGSKDPYALRRAALGVIRTILANRLRINLKKLTLSCYLQQLRLDQVEVRGFERSLYSPQKSFSEELSAGLPDLVRQKIALRTELLWPNELERAEAAKEEFPHIWSELLNVLEYFSDEECARSASDNRIEAEEYRRNYLKPAIERIQVRAKPLVGFLTAFFADRLKVLLRDEGKRHDLVDAVFALGDDDLVRITRRVEALSAFLDTEDGANLLAGYKRATNILKAEAKKTPDEAEGWGVNPEAGTAEEERALAAALRTEVGAVDTALQSEDFTRAMTHLAHLRSPVDAFFDKVLVNDPDPAVRLNRLRLLTQVRDTANRVADFSLISG